MDIRIEALSPRLARGGGQRQQRSVKNAARHLAEREEQSEKMKFLTK